MLNSLCNRNCFKESNSKNSSSKRGLIGNKIADKITRLSKSNLEEAKDAMR